MHKKKPDLDATVELQKLKLSDEYQKQVVIRTDNVSVYTNSENQNDLRSMSSFNEKSIQSQVFRSNFPVTFFELRWESFFFLISDASFQDHFLNVRLLKLSIEEVQQIIRQVTLLDNVQEKLTATVANELLSGPVLMSCDLIELKQVRTTWKELLVSRNFHHLFLSFTSYLNSTWPIGQYLSN